MIKSIVFWIFYWYINLIFNYKKIHAILIFVFNKKHLATGVIIMRGPKISNINLKKCLKLVKFVCAKTLKWLGGWTRLTTWLWSLDIELPGKISSFSTYKYENLYHREIRWGFIQIAVVILWAPKMLKYTSTLWHFRSP